MAETTIIGGEGGEGDFPSVSVNNQIVLFDGTTGQVIKAATTTGILKASTGVIAQAVDETDYLAPTTVKRYTMLFT